MARSRNALFDPMAIGNGAGGDTKSFSPSDQILRPIMKNPLNHSMLPSHRNGFTLVEIMIAGAIATIIGAAAMGFVIEATRATLKTQSNSRNDLTEWGIYTGITIDSRVANGMVL